jgi:hypothetical protein
MLDQALKLFGDTPLIVQTPRPGYQLWYRATGKEKAADLRTSAEALPIEIKAGPSMVIVPPSLNPKLERRYTFYTGVGMLWRVFHHSLTHSSCKPLQQRSTGSSSASATTSSFDFVCTRQLCAVRRMNC